MSYRNPQQVVDTQSGQYIRDLQQTTSRAFAGVAGAYKQEQDQIKAKQEQERKAELKRLEENKAKIDALLKANQKEEDAIYDNLGKVGAKNPDINFTNAFSSIIDTYSDIKDKISLGLITDPKEIANMKSKLAMIKTLPSRAANSLESLMAGISTINEKGGKAGQMGGIDNKTNPQIVKDLLVLGNQIKGGRGFDISEDENGNYQLGFNVEVDGKKTFYSEKTLNEFLTGDNPFVPIIPDETKNFDESRKNVFDIDPNTKKPVVKQKYIGEPKSVVRKGRIVRFDAVNVDAVVDDVRDDLITNVESMSTQQKVSFGNYIGLKDKDGNEVPLTVNNVDQNLGLLEDAYIEMFKKTVPTEANSYSEAIKAKNTSNDNETVGEALSLAKELDADDRLVFDVKKVRDLASSYGLAVEAQNSIKDGPIDKIVIGEYRGKKLTVDENDTQGEMINKIIRVKYPKLNEAQYKEIMSNITGLKPGEGILPIDESSKIDSIVGDNKVKETKLDIFGNEIK